MNPKPIIRYIIALSCWAVVIFSLLLIIGSLWFYLAGYALDCQPDRDSGGYCALRDADGGGRSLQLEASGLSYWRWQGDNRENVRVWALRWLPYVYEDGVWE